MKDRLQIGDLVEFMESIYPKMHKIHRGIIVKKKYGTDAKIYKILTTENETNWVYEEDLIKLEDIC